MYGVTTVGGNCSDCAFQQYMLKHPEIARVSNDKQRPRDLSLAEIMERLA